MSLQKTSITDENALAALRALTSFNALDWHALAQNFKDPTIVTDKHISSLCEAMKVEKLKLFRDYTSIGDGTYQFGFGVKRDGDTCARLYCVDYDVNNGETATYFPY